jgi:hypothetical protein
VDWREQRGALWSSPEGEAVKHIHDFIELVQDLERTVAACLPAGANWKLEWDLKDTITIHLNHRPTEQEREMLRKGTKR